MSGGTQCKYDAVLMVSFGGPEKKEDVIPFLENTLRGRNIPRERMLEIAGHYYHFGGRSPINDENRALIRALEAELKSKGPALPVYWGNRNWRPILTDTLRAMKTDGVRRALAFVTSAYSSYSGCRQYLENIENARREAGEGAPAVDKLRVFYNHPRFIQVWVERIREALEKFPSEKEDAVHIVYTAHSIPLSMANNCAYVRQLEETCRLVSEGLSRSTGPLVFQSRSGSPSQPWLGPDIKDYLREFAARGKNILIAPVGFISDHMEVVYDLDTEAQGLCEELGMKMARASTPGAHPEFVSMIRELILERTEEGAERRAIGKFGPNHDFCLTDCCLLQTGPR
ncbi:MAG: ferrochelatase [Terriglobia bacterium]